MKRQQLYKRKTQFNIGLGKYSKMLNIGDI